MIRKIITNLKIDLVVDAGANCGQYGEWLRSIVYSGIIYSFEPVAESFAKLQKVAEADAQWFCFKTALGDRTEEIQLKTQYAHGRSVFNSLLPIRRNMINDPAKYDYEIKETVSVERLDNIIDIKKYKENPRIFLKTDTQGFDLQVLRGAAGCMLNIEAIQSKIPTIGLYDGASSCAEILGYLEDMDFLLQDLFEVNRTDYGGVLEYDCLSVRRSRVQEMANTGQARR